MRKDRTKWLIVDALREMIRTVPVDDISVSDLAAAIGSSRQAFYYHFENLFEVSSWAVNTRFEALAEKHEATSVLELMYDFLKAMETEKEIVIAFYRSNYREQIRKRLIMRLDGPAYSFAEAMLGDKVGELDIAGAARFLVHAYTGTITDWIYSGMVIPSEEVKAMMQRIVVLCLNSELVASMEKRWE